MPRFRATVYILTSAVAAVEGDQGISRHIIELEAEDREMFKAEIHDQHLHDVDCEIDFGPITEKEHEDYLSRRY